MSAKFKVSFTLDASDVQRFRSFYQEAKERTRTADPERILTEARATVKKVRSLENTPRFVTDAITVLADLADLIQDDDYGAPKKVKDKVLAAIAYFSDPEDLIPDNIPGLGFLDDAIMVKFIEEELKHELWGYRKFRKMRDASEQRPWAAVARERLKQRLAADRKKIRGEIAEREAKEALKKRSHQHGGW